MVFLSGDSVGDIGNGGAFGVGEGALANVTVELVEEVHGVELLAERRGGGFFDGFAGAAVAEVRDGFVTLAERVDRADRQGFVGELDAAVVTALVEGVFGVVEQVVHGAAEGFHGNAGGPFVPGDDGLFAGGELKQVGPVAVGFFAEGEAEGGPAVANGGGDGVPLMNVSEGNVIEAFEEGCGNPVDATDADVAFGVATGRGVGVTGGVADGGVAHDDDTVGAFAVGPTVGDVRANGVGDGPEDGAVRGLNPKRGGVQARREVGDGVDVYALGTLDELDGTGNVLESGSDVHARGLEEGRPVAEAAEGIVVAGAEDNLHICLNEAGESPVEQGGAFGCGDATVVDVPADEEGADTFGTHVVEQFVDELSVLVGEGAAVKGAAEVPVGSVQNFHGFSMAPLEKVRLAVRHSRFGPHRGVGAHAERGLRPRCLPIRGVGTPIAA